MTVLLIILGVAFTGMTVSGVICYRRLAVPSMLPLAEQDLDLCRQVVARHDGLLWICRHALKTGQCPCQPCEKIERERELGGERVREVRKARELQADRERNLELEVEALR
jgi:hypothetical protein